MNNNRIRKKHSAALRFGAVACACVVAGLVAGQPEPAGAGWLERLFSTTTTKKRLHIRNKRREQVRRRLGQTRTSPTASSLLDDAPNVDENEPVQIVVSLERQQVTVYKGGVQIATSRVSSGKPGHTTPSGVYSILQKKRLHFSNIYDSAPMPFMQRLTWSGVALHAGVVPNYPASHGCIRLPPAFARQLFAVTQKGEQVIVASGESVVGEITHRKLFKPAVLATIFDPKFLTAATRGTSQAVEADAGPDEANAPPLFPNADRRQVSTDKAPAAKPGGSPRDRQMASIDIGAERLHVFGGRDERPLRILITRKTARERIMEIQDSLNRLGYDVGEPDGKLGRQTRKAIRDFQKKQDLRVTGTESEDLWRRLNSAAGIWRYSTGHLYVRQGMKDLFDGPVTINQPDDPLGTHVYMAMHFETDATSSRWTAATLKQKRPPRRSEHIQDDEMLAKANAVSAVQALERIEIPDSVRRRIESMLTPGSSLIISDNGIDPRETTNQGTDLIVRTW